MLATGGAVLSACWPATVAEPPDETALAVFACGTTIAAEPPEEAGPATGEAASSATVAEPPEEVAPAKYLWSGHAATSFMRSIIVPIAACWE